MHSLDTLMRLNAEHAGREAAHEFKDGNTLGDAKSEEAAIEQYQGLDRDQGIDTFKAYLRGYRKGLEE